MRRGVIAVLLLLSLWAPKVWAQQPSDSMLASLKPDRMVRLRLPQGETVEGRLKDFGGDYSLIRLADPKASVPKGSVDSLWVRKNAAETGAVVGALVLAVPAGLLAGYLAWGDNETNPKSDAPAILGGAAVGALVGGVIGAAIGSGYKSWQLEYARPSISLGPSGTTVGASLRYAF